MKSARVIVVGVVFLIVLFMTWRLVNIKKPSNGLNSASTAQSAPGTWADTLPIFTESSYHIKIPKYFGRTTNKQIQILASGSGFILEAPQGFFVITAGHVVDAPGSLNEITDGEEVYKINGNKNNSITKTYQRIRVGDVSLHPQKIWFGSISKANLDIAIMTVRDPNPLRTRPLKPTQVSKGQEVNMYGYPAAADTTSTDNESSKSTPKSTSNAAHRTQMVTSLESDYFVAEGTQFATAGFSGGPVLNPEGEVVGMIIRSAGGQTRCIYISTILEAISQFESEAANYQE